MSIPPLIPRNRSSPSPHPLRPTSDNAVKLTNDDATVSRLSAINLNYLSDSHLHHFVRKSERRPPIINRGTYCRTVAIDDLIQKFLKADILGTTKNCDSNSNIASKQIVSLGAGTDTRWFNLAKNPSFIPYLQQTRYFEVDFAETTSKKISVIKRFESDFEASWNTKFNYDQNETELFSNNYNILVGDLRTWEEDVITNLTKHGFDINTPTLYLSECVLIYLSPSEGDTILSWISEHHKSSLAFFICYEQVNPDDAFGKVMINNLKARNLELKSLSKYPTLQTQQQRFLSLNWNTVQWITIKQYWDKIVPDAEKKRLSKIEIFDEVEEWNMIAEHYFVLWSCVCNPDREKEFQELKEAVRIV
ncbi:S-adenosyl-L-methionine-dependent methyltransferase [Paraphysoderma sedebokerense]|nr:S-adenosyl-L-methionine-dependent methyltransferase [Paraphysoderma sedebokerense]